MYDVYVIEKRKDRLEKLILLRRNITWIFGEAPLNTKEHQFLISYIAQQRKIDAKKGVGRKTKNKDEFRPKKGGGGRLAFQSNFCFNFSNLNNSHDIIFVNSLRIMFSVSDPDLIYVVQSMYSYVCGSAVVSDVLLVVTQPNNHYYNK